MQSATEEVEGADHVITQDASLILSILAEQEGHPIPLVVTQVHVDGRWHR